MREIGEISNSERYLLKNMLFFSLNYLSAALFRWRNAGVLAVLGQNLKERKRRKTGLTARGAIELGISLAGTAKLARTKTPLFCHFVPKVAKRCFLAWGRYYSLNGSQFSAKTVALACFGQKHPFWFKIGIKINADFTEIGPRGVAQTSLWARPWYGRA